MKVVWLSLGMLFLLVCYEFFSDYDSEILYLVHIITPAKFSTSNPNTITVSSLSPKAKISENDNIKVLPNSQFTYEPKDFDIDDTELLREIGLTCVPESFGYTQERGLEVFPYYGYPKCSLVNKQNDTYLYIDRKSNLLYMNCPDNNNGYFLSGPIGKNKIAKSDELENIWTVSKYTGPVDASNLEFGLGSCGGEEKLVQGFMSPILNHTIYKSAKALTTSKPKIIFFLTLDSMSRRHSFRKIPKVINFLNSLNQNMSNFSVFDYKLHNILGPNSVSNQVPIFGKKENFVNNFEGKQEIDYLKDHAIWSILRKKGYISLLGLENCDNYFPSSLGRRPKVDYSVGPFYCAVQKFAATSFDKEFTLTQRCLGGHMTHYYILNYTTNLVRMHKDLMLKDNLDKNSVISGPNMFLYIHLNAAHEATGLHAETLNEDLYDFLKEFLEEFKEYWDMFIFLQADHGMRYGNWFHDLDAYQENKLPSLFVIANNELLDKYPKSYHCLANNAERLTSKLDLRETALYLGDVIEESPISINLLTKIAPKSRTCKDLNIEPWDCSCVKMTEIDFKDEKISKLVESLKNYAEHTINSGAYTNFMHPLGKICKRITLDNITKVYHVDVSNIHEFFKVEIESNTQKGMKFQVNFFIAADGLNMMRNKYMFRVEKTAFADNPIKARVWAM